MTAAIEDPNPVFDILHKALYRSITKTGNVSEKYYTNPIGKAKLIELGDSLVLLPMGWSTLNQKIINDLKISADILDLRTLLPLDKNAIFNSVRKTNRVLNSS